jgi:hypothetical protein
VLCWETVPLHPARLYFFDNIFVLQNKEGVCILVCTVKGAFSATEKTKTQVNVFYDQTASNTQVM